jgi:hypothetical protein
VKDAKCHEPTYAVQQIWSLLDHLVGGLLALEDAMIEEERALQAL